MKNMVLLIDANVILDYLVERQSQFYDAKCILTQCHNPHVKGYVAFHSISIIWYALRKTAIKDRRRALLEITDLLTVTGAPHEEVVNAIINENFSDFEDCLQEKCALNVSADYIVTNNVKDFKTSKVPALTPIEMLKIIVERRIGLESQEIN